MGCLVTKEVAFEHNQMMAVEISSGLFILPIGSCEIIAWRLSGVPPLKCWIIEVSMIPGATALMRIFYCA
jgi:hypothetical protein